MNRQDSNNPFPRWGLLLIVPMIFAVALYLHLKQSSSPALPELTTNASAPDVEVAAFQSDEARRSIDFESPAITPDKIETPIGLDPETARTAVQQVENSVYERATAMFGREPVDVEWAGAYEQSLREMFSQHHGLQRVSINSISCHTSMCRIEVFTPRDTDADFFTAMFYDALANFRAGALKAEAAITRRMEQGMTSVYVARKDHTLGFY